MAERLRVEAAERSDERPRAAAGRLPGAVVHALILRIADANRLHVLARTLGEADVEPSGGGRLVGAIEAHVPQQVGERADLVARLALARIELELAAEAIGTQTAEAGEGTRRRGCEVQRTLLRLGIHGAPGGDGRHDHEAATGRPPQPQPHLASSPAALPASVASAAACSPVNDWSGCSRDPRLARYTVREQNGSAGADGRLLASPTGQGRCRSSSRCLPARSPSPSRAPCCGSTVAGGGRTSLCGRLRCSATAQRRPRSSSPKRGVGAWKPFACGTLRAVC